MRRVSLNKIKLSMVTKVPGMVILGVLAIAFLLFPLAALAACGQQPAQAATIESTESLLGPGCAGSPLTNAEESALNSSWIQPQKNATVSTTTPKTSASGTASQPSDSSINFLARMARCSFETAKTGQNVPLVNGVIGLATLDNKDGTTSPIIFEIVGGKPVAVTGGNGQHFVKLNSNPNIKFTNGSISNDD
jgi:hypothetical protein